MIDKRLLSLTKGSRIWIFAVVIIGLIIVILNVSQIFLIGHSLDQIRAEKYDISLIVIGLALIILLRSLFVGFGQLARHKIAAKTKITLRDKLYQQIIKLGPAFLSGERTGALVNTAVSGVENLEVYFGRYLPQLFLGLSIPLLICLIILCIDPITATALFLAQVLIPVSLMIIQKKLKAVSDRYWTSENHLMAQFLDSMQGLVTLKMFNRGKAQGDIVRTETEQLRQKTMHLLAVNQVSLIFIDWVASLGSTVLASGLAIWRLQQGTITFGEGVILILLSIELARPLALLGSFFHAGASGVSAAQHIFEILEKKPEVVDIVNPIVPSGCLSKIEFKEVGFSYPDTDDPDKFSDALNGVSFKINSGERVALVGPSGAGKSSIVNLLIRFYDPQTGTIFINGTPLTSIQLKWLRSQIAIVSQDTYLFYGTIADNLRLAKPDATIEELEQAARIANIHQFIAAQPDYYDSMLGERGLTISGGQAQRLAIARAVLKDAPIIILDEATSHVDIENEAIIQASLDKLTQDKTVLIIAHRLSTIRNANRILVFNKGKIVETGNFEELSKKGIWHPSALSITEDGSLSVRNTIPTQVNKGAVIG